jgi:hypothetical protein
VALVDAKLESNRSKAQSTATAGVKEKAKKTA